jgi:hypothetical protein
MANGNLPARIAGRLLMLDASDAAAGVTVRASQCRFNSLVSPADTRFPPTRWAAYSALSAAAISEAGAVGSACVEGDTEAIPIEIVVG